MPCFFNCSELMTKYTKYSSPYHYIRAEFTSEFLQFVSFVSFLFKRAVRREAAFFNSCNGYFKNTWNNYFLILLSPFDI